MAIGVMTQAGTKRLDLHWMPNTTRPWSWTAANNRSHGNLSRHQSDGYLKTPLSGGTLVDTRDAERPRSRSERLLCPLVLHSFMCRLLHMATNLAIDDKLLEEARRVGGHRTKKATVTEALWEYIRRRKQLDIVRLFGTIEFDPEFDWKSQRKKS